MSGEELVKSEEELNGYRLEKIIGSDADGRLVFRSVNYHRQHMVLKVIQTNSSNLDASINQAIFCCQINHQYIAACVQWMIRCNNQQLVLFMEYCQGNLGKDLKRLKEQQLISCARSITDALFHIHQNLSISHCDVRPQSIQLSPNNPKVSFYSLKLLAGVHRQCYLPPEFDGTYSMEGDMWSLGLTLVQLFSKMRLSQIFPDLKGKRKPIHQLRKFSVSGLLRQIRNRKIANLLKDIFKYNPTERPNIRQFYTRLLGTLNSPTLFIPKEVAEHNSKYSERKERFGAIKRFQAEDFEAISNHQSKGVVESSFIFNEKHIPEADEVYHGEKSEFKISEDRDRRKLKIVNFSSMKIIKIEQIHGADNLQWLYLEHNSIARIQNMSYPNLKGLNLGHNQISRIENLDQLRNLEQLYLHSNMISAIQNLEQLGKLKWLYLNDNKIKKVENLWELKNLKTVALKNNPIDRFEAVNVTAVARLKSQLTECYLSEN